MTVGRAPDRYAGAEEDAVTARIPVPRQPTATVPTGPRGDVDAAPPATGTSGRDRRRHRRRWVTVIAVLAAVLVVVGAVTIWSSTLAPPHEVTASEAPAPVVTPSATRAAAPAPAEGSSCPSADKLLAVFGKAKPRYAAAPRATSAVTCASGFAVMSLRSSSTPDGLRTIFAIGPPIRLLNVGTGPICSAGSGDGVVVPRSAGAKLGCAPGQSSTPRASAPTSSSSSTPGRGATGSSPAPRRSGTDPYGCLAERAAQDRAYDNGRLVPNSELVCNYNYGPTLPSTRQQCWLADHDRDNGSGPMDDRARRDFKAGCSQYGY